MKYPVPKKRLQTLGISCLDPAQAEKAARLQFKQREESCIKAVEIRECQDMFYQTKPGNVYQTVEQF